MWPYSSILVRYAHSHIILLIFVRSCRCASSHFPLCISSDVSSKTPRGFLPSSTARCPALCVALLGAVTALGAHHFCSLPVPSTELPNLSLRYLLLRTHD
ncbi:hypothetical protein BD309DRAFT_959508 [Dichomitus squalens]|uniref:Uncharacterized protein n=1 Tax=Dichomitus squalens TaxID=114155 RepID=A0A4Q9PFI8_9APHY|nr:hypothetical protein BD309DRAFT_959508 [Dichomitus squalens]TBU53719.1 hypothetical protein BD310DRAFT_937412 [Dichomitus squalens]